MGVLRVVRKLVEGSSAEVFLAQKKGSEDQYIVNLVRTSVSSDPLQFERLIELARLRQEMFHPNLTRWMTVSVAPEGRWFTISEKIDSSDLKTWIREKGVLSLADLIQLLLPLCEAVSYLHSKGLVHGGIKPSNVFLPGGLRAFKPKLLEYGLAFYRSGIAPSFSQVDLLANPAYAAPECVQGENPSTQSDIYNLGILIFEALTGKPPFTGEDPQSVLELHTHALIPELPPEGAAIQGIVERCLSKSPADRFAIIEELKAALTDTEMPQVFGNYQVIRPLGEGAMAQVFLARHVKLDRRVAIKLLKPEHSKNQDLINRFFQEARTVNQINHQHIVEIFDFVEEPLGSLGNQRVYCVMEALSGVTLGEMIKSGKARLQPILKILIQVCDALTAAHRVGVVHRDVKPDNIFVAERNGRTDFVKVLDFGVAKLMPTFTAGRVDGTLGGLLVGTPAFMSPEQASGREVDARADVHAIGVILYLVLSGRVPFQAASLVQQLSKIITDPAPPFRDTTPLGESIPVAMREGVLRCLAKDPSERPEMGQLQEMLESWRDLCDPPAVQRRPFPGLTRGAPVTIDRAKLFWAGGAAMGLLIALLLTSWVLIHRSRLPTVVAVPPERNSPAAAPAHAAAVPVPPADFDASTNDDSLTDSPIYVPKTSSPVKKVVKPARVLKRKEVEPERDDVLNPFE